MRWEADLQVSQIINYIVCSCFNLIPLNTSVNMDQVGSESSSPQIFDVAKYNLGQAVNISKGCLHNSPTV